MTGAHEQEAVRRHQKDKEDQVVAELRHCNRVKTTTMLSLFGEQVDLFEGIKLIKGQKEA